MERQNEQDNAPGRDADPNVTEEKPTNRRNMLRLGGLAAAAGAGAVLLKPGTADAVTGAMQYGTANDAGVNPTQLGSTCGDSPTLAVIGGEGGALEARSSAAFATVFSAVTNGHGSTAFVASAGDTRDSDDAATMYNGGLGTALRVQSINPGSARPGIHAIHHGSGSGVRAEKPANTTGAALQGVAPVASAVALDVQGRAQFSRSGVAVIPAGGSSVAVTSIPLQPSALVLAVLQSNHIGVWVRAAIPVPYYAAIVIALNTTVSSAAKVGWFVVG